MTSNSSCSLLSLMDMMFAYLVKIGSFIPCSWRWPRYRNKTIQWIRAQIYILKSLWKLESLVKLPATHTDEFGEQVIASALLTQIYPTQKPMSRLLVLGLKSHWSCLPVAAVYGINLKLFLFLGMEMPTHIQKVVIKKKKWEHTNLIVHIPLWMPLSVGSLCFITLLINNL